jgi:acyl-CoA synthetase (AMP-forming)/AMP-acid ligase II
MAPDETNPAADEHPWWPGARAAAQPDAPAQIMADTGDITTYAELHAGANRLARWLQGQGLQPGDHVAFCMENHPRYLEVAWGCDYAGLVFTAISSRLTAEEAAYIIGDCGARAYVTSRYLAHQAAELVPLTGELPRLMLDGIIAGYDSYEDSVDGLDSSDLDHYVEGVDMLYSSGTTGRPKGVDLPLPAGEMGSPNALVLLTSMLFGFQPGSIYLSPAPLYHAAPLRFCMSAQRAGGTVIVMTRFDPEQYLALIDRYKVTQTQVVPTMFIRLLKLPEEVRSRYEVSSLTHVVHAAAPCPVEAKQAMIEWWGPIIHEYYAGTEGNGFVYCNSEQWLAHPGTVGTALQGQIHICGPDGEEVAAGEAGTIYFGGGEFRYHNDDAKTAESRNPSHPEWSTLGDIGYLDADGFLYLTDRKAHMIISGGVNIYPQEAENLLALHPKVDDVAVIGVPNEEMGEEVKAVVQVAPGVDANQDLADELIAYCREHLALDKCPRTIDFDPELPRHPTGKLYKRLVRDRFWPDAAAPAAGA